MAGRENNMNWTLFKMTLKKNWTLMLIFYGVIAMYQIIMVSMYDPDQIDALMAMTQMMPPEIMKAMGFSTMVTDITGYLASWLYGILMFGFPMVYCIILGNRLVAKKVDNGSFTYFLTTPHSRTEIVSTLGIYSIFSVILLFLLFFLTGTITCNLAYPGLLDVSAFFKLNFTTMLVNITVMMITFASSCIFNEAGLSTGFGSGIPILFILMYMMGGVSPDSEFIKKISIFGFYDPVELIRGASVIVPNIIYLVSSALLFTVSILVFRKKRLPI